MGIHVLGFPSRGNVADTRVVLSTYKCNIVEILVSTFLSSPLFLHFLSQDNTGYIKIKKTSWFLFPSLETCSFLLMISGIPEVRGTQGLILRESYMGGQGDT